MHTYVCTEGHIHIFVCGKCMQKKCMYHMWENVEVGKRMWETYTRTFFTYTFKHFSPTFISPHTSFTYIALHFPTYIFPHIITFSHIHTFSQIHFPTYISPHTYTFFTYISHLQMYVCDPEFHTYTYIHFWKKMYVPHTYVYVCKMFTDICSHTLVCTTLVKTQVW